MYELLELIFQDTLQSNIIKSVNIYLSSNSNPNYNNLSEPLKQDLEIIKCHILSSVEFKLQYYFHIIKNSPPTLSAKIFISLINFLNFLQIQANRITKQTGIIFRYKLTQANIDFSKIDMQLIENIMITKKLIIDFSSFELQNCSFNGSAVKYICWNNSILNNIRFESECVLNLMGLAKNEKSKNLNFLNNKYLVRHHFFGEPEIFAPTTLITEIESKLVPNLVCSISTVYLMSTYISLLEAQLEKSLSSMASNSFTIFSNDSNPKPTQKKHSKSSSIFIYHQSFKEEDINFKLKNTSNKSRTLYLIFLIDTYIDYLKKNQQELESKMNFMSQQFSLKSGPYK